MVQWWSETFFLLSSLSIGGDKHVGGHNFKTYSFPTARWCDICGRFLWGLVRQGMKCKSMLARGGKEDRGGRRGGGGREERGGRREEEGGRRGKKREGGRRGGRREEEEKKREEGGKRWKEGEEATQMKISAQDNHFFMSCLVSNYMYN